MFNQPLISLSGILLLVSSALSAQPLLEIWQIQGSGAASPYAGQQVRTPDNVVTARSFDGFFLQTPIGRSDGNPQTSDGMFVYQGQAPTVRPGDRVTITGLIRERGGLTEFAEGATVTVLGSDGELPDPMALIDQFPSPVPEAIPQLERAEGMRVTFSGYAAGPSNRFGECPVTIRRERPFREAGIAWPGRAGLPVWDGNPEVFWLDTYPENVTIRPGAAIQATGVLTFAFNRYQVQSDSYTVDSSAAAAPALVRDRRPGEYTVASLNVLRLTPGAANYAVKLAKLAQFIGQVMDGPDVVALQEIGAARALDDLAEQIRRIDPSLTYTPYFRLGNDDINQGFLVGSRIRVDRLDQLAATERLSTTEGLLHDRPPLLLTARLGPTGPAFQLLNVHLRSRIGIEEADSLFVRQKRYEQSLSIARLAEARRDSNLLVAGDFNAYPFTDGYVDVVNQITGLPSLGALLPPQPLVSPPLSNLTATLANETPYSYVRNGNAELIDHCLGGDLAGIRLNGLQFAHGNADSPELFADDSTLPWRCSDHDGWVLFLEPEPFVSRQASAIPTTLRIDGPSFLHPGEALDITAAGNRPVWLTLTSLDGRLILRMKTPGPHIHFPLPNFLTAGGYVLTATQGEQQMEKRIFLY